MARNQSFFKLSSPAGDAKMRHRVGDELTPSSFPKLRSKEKKNPISVSLELRFKKISYPLFELQS